MINTASNESILSSMERCFIALQDIEPPDCILVIPFSYKAFNIITLTRFDRPKSKISQSSMRKRLMSKL